MQEIQSDLLNLLSKDTILIGHGLENDLRALHLVHNKIIDTSLHFQKSDSSRPGLKNLAKERLKRTIQDRQDGHDSYEDAMASMDLVLHALLMEIKAEKANYQDSFGNKTDGLKMK